MNTQSRRQQRRSLVGLIKWTAIVSWRSSQGRLYIYRDAPDWFVDFWADMKDESTCGREIRMAREERALRQRQHALRDAEIADTNACKDARNVWRWTFAAALVAEMQSVCPLNHADSEMAKLTAEHGPLPSNWPSPIFAAKALAERWD